MTQRANGVFVPNQSLGDYMKDMLDGTKVVAVALGTGTAGGGVASWQNPEATPIIIRRAWVDVTTVATAAGTVSVGATPTSATTSSANLIDTLDVHSATGVFDNLNSAGTNGKSIQKLAVGKWVTASQATGAVAGLAGNLYIEYTTT